MNENSCYSICLTAFVVVNVLNFGLSNRCVVVSHCCNLQFPNDTWCVTSFHMLSCYLYIFFGKVLVTLLPIFKIGLLILLLLSFQSSLYILDNSPLTDVSFANIFSQSVACVLILLILSFTEKKIFNCNEVQVIKYSFMDQVLPLVLYLKRNCQSKVI